MLEERKLSPSQRLLRRENEPRFSESEGKKETKRRQNNSEVCLYEDLLQREKQTLGKLKDKASARQILQLVKSVRVLRNAKQVKRSGQRSS